MEDIYKQRWVQQVNVNSQCTNYRMFKNKMETECYLYKLEFIHRVNLAKFRCRSNNLPVVASRFHDVSPKCSFCNKNEVGDEFHYVNVCPFFREERKKFLGFYANKRANAISFDKIMNKKNLCSIKNLARFVQVVMKSCNESQNNSNITVTSQVNISTRSGRTVKKPVKLDL